MGERLLIVTSSVTEWLFLGYNTAVPENILQTKLYIPPVWPNLVRRSRLIDRLNQGQNQGRKVTLISAPAGFGKSTLVSEWVDQKVEGGGMKAYPERRRREESGESRHPSSSISYPSNAAWLSLDVRDNEPTRFLTYLVAALQTLDLSETEGANIGAGVLANLQDPQPPPTESILTELLNEIAAIPDKFILVLDDYHVIDTQPVDEALTFLLEHQPPQMHVVIATREDPLLPLARLRARGQLTELRVADLRFTTGEAATFLNQMMGLGLSAEEVDSLEARTEGWIAGLQLAAISMRGREDVSGFIRAFAGDNRYIVDYLVEEVLQGQPENIHNFLLETSILDRLSGPLCDAVRFDTAETPSGQKDGQRMLEALERGNLFVVPLDDKRQWYRYHHLFADVLQARLLEEQSDQLPGLHRRVSEWYERNGMPADAIRHAFAAEDYKRAAGLIELEWRAMDRSFQSATWLGWVKALPDELVRARPVLSAEYGWALLDNGELEAAESRLRDAERWLEMMGGQSERSKALAAGMVVVDEEEFESLPVTLNNARAFQAQALGDVPGTLKYTKRNLDLLPEDNYFERGIQAAVLGLAYWGNGELEAAHRSVADGVRYMRQANNILFAVSGTSTLADIRIAQGRLHEAVSTYEQSLQLALEQGERVLQGTADLYLGLSGLHYELGDLGAAKQQLLRSEELGEAAALPHWHHRRHLGHAQIKQAQGDLNGAVEELQEAERLFTRHAIPDVRPIAAWKTRVWVMQGRVAEALGWAREQGLAVDDDLSYLREFEYITLARALIARYKSERPDGDIQEAMGLLRRLLKAAEEGGRMGSVIEILALQALAEQAQGDVSQALDSLERALTLAEPEGYVQIFVDEGPPMVALLRRMKSESGRLKAYISKLLAAFGKRKTPLPSALSPQPLVEPLSERELEVLGLLGGDLNGPEIAADLMVSLNTMRSHTKHIYNKLEVNNRRAAVRRAKELGLL